MTNEVKPPEAPHKCVSLAHSFRRDAADCSHRWEEDHRHDNQGLVIERCICSAMRFYWPVEAEWIAVGFHAPNTFGLVGNVVRRQHEAMQIVGAMRAQMDPSLRKTDTFPWRQS